MRYACGASSTRTDPPAASRRCVGGSGCDLRTGWKKDGGGEPSGKKFESQGVSTEVQAAFGRESPPSAEPAGAPNADRQTLPVACSKRRFAEPLTGKKPGWLKSARHERSADPPGHYPGGNRSNVAVIRLHREAGEITIADSPVRRVVLSLAEANCQQSSGWVCQMAPLADDG